MREQSEIGSARRGGARAQAPKRVRRGWQALFALRTSTTWAPPEPSSLQPEPQPSAQSDGIAKEVRSIDCPPPPAHCQRTPRSPTNDPRSFPRAAVGMGRVGTGSAAGRAPRRQCTPSVLIWVTAQATPATSISNTEASAPKPVPRTVRSVPPASEPVIGLMEVMRGGISASNGSPGRTGRERQPHDARGRV